MKKCTFSLVFILSLLLQNPLKGQSLERDNTVIKVLTFNILHGATTKGDFNLDVIAGVIKDANPDLVALQEVDYLTNRARKYDIVTELGQRCKMSPLFGRAMYFDEGEYGEGILSKTTIIQSRNVPLPCSPGREPRSALEITTVTSYGDTICLIGTHLDHTRDESDRISQVHKINNVFSSNKYPTLLAGDLNATPGSTPINLLEKVWTPTYDKADPAPTFPSKAPRKKIDYIMYIPANGWKIIDSEVIENEIASDHCAYLVTMELLEE